MQSKDLKAYHHPQDILIKTFVEFQVASQVMLAPPTPLESKRPAPKNGKTSTRSGFGKLFRLGSRRSGSHEQTEGETAPFASPGQQSSGT